MNISKSRLAVVAAGALVVVATAGAGGAVAGSLITGADIQDKSIQKVDLAPGSVTSGKIVDGTIQAKDLAAGVAGGAAPAHGITWVSQPQDARTTDGTGIFLTDNVYCPAGTYMVSVGDGVMFIANANNGGILSNTDVGTVKEFTETGNPKGLDSSASYDLDVDGSTSTVVTVTIPCTY